jgi:hypothetical protein
VMGFHGQQLRVARAGANQIDFSLEVALHVCNLKFRLPV